MKLTPAQLEHFKTRIGEIIDELRTVDDREPLEAELAGIIEQLPTSFLGPTWQKTDEGKWWLPKYSLGKQIAIWCATYLSAAKGRGTWKFTNEQLRFLLWWYAVDEDGQFLFRTGVLQRLKGWGKDPLLAVISLVEFVGPCRFSHWEHDAAGNKTPVGTDEPDAWIQIAAVSQKQTKNTSLMVLRLVTPKLKKKYQIADFSASSETIRAQQGKKQIEMVTSNPRSLEGGRATFVVLNETHHWVEGNDGHTMYETIDGNVTKGGGEGARYLAITNAYLPGEDSVAERVRYAWQRIQEGKAVDIGMLYDSVEAHELVPMHPVALEVVIPIIRGDATWLNVKSIMASIQNEAIPVVRSRRMWLNQIRASDDSMYSESDWDVLECTDYLRDGDEVVLGMDGGRTDDSTALIAIRVSDGLVTLLDIWEKPDGVDRWKVNPEAVDSKVAWAHRTYKVVGFYSDVQDWESFVLKWDSLYSERYSIKANGAGNSVGWDMRAVKRTTMAHERLIAAITDGTLKWSYRNDSPLAKTLRRHVLNVYRYENNFGVSFRKESRESRRKIDAYAALVAAYQAYTDLLERGKPVEDEAPARVYFFR